VTKDSQRPLLRPAIGLGVVAFALIAAIASLVTWGSSIVDVLSYIAIPLAFGGIGAFLWTRVPENPIGPMLLVATIGFAALIGSGTWLVLNVQGTTTDPLAIVMALAANLTFIPALMVVIVGLLEILGIGRAVLAQPEWLGASFEVYAFVAAVFFGLSYTMSHASYRLEAALGVGRR